MLIAVLIVSQSTVKIDCYTLQITLPIFCWEEH